MPKLTGKQVRERSRELRTIREKAIQMFLENHDKDYREVARFFNLPLSTVARWKKRALKGVIKPKPKPSVDKILETVDSPEALGRLIVDSFMEAIRKRDETIKHLEDDLREILRQRDEITKLYNELKAQQVSKGKFTIDQVRRVLIPKREEK